MHPILFQVGPLTLYSYGAMMVLAFVTATWLAARAARGLSPALRAIAAEQLLDFSSLSLVGGLVGARLLFVSLHWDEFSSDPLEILAVWHGGLVWYGGFLGGLLAGSLYVRAQRLEFLRVLDQFIPFLTLGHAIGRVGCLLNGCCYGKPTDAWCGLVFPGQDVAVFPTQLLESLGLLLLFLVLRALQRPGLLQYPGRVFGAYLAGYAALRFALEFTRGDQAPWWMGLTLQQVISIAVFMFGGWLLLRRATPRRAMRV